jgi:hypothetical protein
MFCLFIVLAGYLDVRCRYESLPAAVERAGSLKLLGVEVWCFGAQAKLWGGAMSLSSVIVSHPQSRVRIPSLAFFGLFSLTIWRATAMISKYFCKGSAGI